MNGNALTWLESAGGPLILLEEDFVPYWRGYLSVPEASMTDYERACEVSDYIGSLDVASGSGVVLGEQPYSTTWWQGRELEYGLIVRWVTAENEAAVMQALTKLSNPNWERTGVTFDVTRGRLLLFDSAVPGNEVETFLSIQISIGSYVAETLHYNANRETSLILHRFVPRASS